MPIPNLTLRIAGKRMLTPDICRFDLRDPAGHALPAFTPGAHVDVRTPSGATRSYSLAGDAGDRDRYVIAVSRETTGRGGSMSLVDDTATGDLIDVAVPSNAFELLPAQRYVLIAGGIGITPIRAMYRALRRAGHPRVTVIYLTRTLAEAAFADEFAPGADPGAGLHLHASDESGRLDLWPWLAEPDDDARIYFCGGTALMDDVRALTMHWRPSRIHFEDFTGVSTTAGAGVPFRVTWQPTGQQVTVPSNRSLLDALRGLGLEVAASCESGTCGTCRLRLHDGTPEHRDHVLDERTRSHSIMPCVSRARSESLVVGPPG
ncbi:PDR/VanB family oxidoreductase [Streptomyces sp. NPDC051976]|uniref:PDR/VanB family oxidoreductase n=1 Tax=Streptomyces sp. NPDC051976 TaxID=3154947 RepID=UPI0034377FC1